MNSQWYPDNITSDQWRSQGGGHWAIAQRLKIYCPIDFLGNSNGPTPKNIDIHACMFKNVDDVILTLIAGEIYSNDREKSIDDIFHRSNNQNNDNSIIF